TQFAVIRRSTEHQYGAPSSSSVQPNCISFAGQPFTHQQASRPLAPTTHSHCPADGSISPPRHLRPRLFRPGQQLPSRHGGQHLRVSTHPIHGHDQPINSVIPPKSSQQLHDWPSSIYDHGSPSILRSPVDPAVLFPLPRAHQPAPLSRINPRSNIHVGNRMSTFDFDYSGAWHHITDRRCRAEDPTKRKQLAGVSIPSSRPTVPKGQQAALPIDNRPPHVASVQPMARARSNRPSKTHHQDP
ncbi:hypothetical protein ACLOJK_018746, partial [Asimina triloba]